MKRIVRNPSIFSFFENLYNNESPFRDESEKSLERAKRALFQSVLLDPEEKRILDIALSLNLRKFIINRKKVLFWIGFYGYCFATCAGETVEIDMELPQKELVYVQENDKETGRILKELRNYLSSL